jgi:hypothetical protein
MLLIFFFFLCRTGTGGMIEGEGRRKKTTWHAVWDLEGMDGMRCETQRKEEGGGRGTPLSVARLFK